MTVRRTTQRQVERLTDVQMQAESLRELVESSFHSAAQAFVEVHAQLESEDTGPGDQQRKANETHKVSGGY